MLCIQYYFAFLFVIFCNQCHFSKGEALVGSNIKPAKDSEFPFVVSIGYRRDNLSPDKTHFCTGTLISNKHVLTAAHCLVGEKVNGVQIVMGSHDLRAGEKYRPASWINYTDWARQKNRPIPDISRKEDVAVITLSHNVKSGIQSVIRTTLKNDRYFGEAGRIVGWGVTNSGGVPRYLQTARVKIIPRDVCEEHLGRVVQNNVILDEKVFCTARNPHVLFGCGDSGGPLLDQNKVLVGINRATCPTFQDLVIRDSDKVNIHSAVEFYKDFIDDVMENF